VCVRDRGRENQRKGLIEMGYLDFRTEAPGILQAMMDYPETARPMNMLADELLRTDEGGLTRGEREFIAACVSRENQCNFCTNTHLNVALTHLQLPHRMVDPFSDDVAGSVEVRPVVRALVTIAQQVQQGGLAVTADAIKAARDAGANDRMIHDTVLIAAAFCMYNRYVDGLRTISPRDADLYAASGDRLAETGYVGTISG
jgi:uncharacterized peroxidase-related enzyme